jgi:hypothetical protein
MKKISILKKLSNVVGGTLILSVTFLSVRSCFVKNMEVEEIRGNPAFISGKIVKLLNLSGYSGYSAEYRYQVGTIIYQSDRTVSEQCCKGFLEQRFPIIYSKKNPAINRMLVTSSDFEEFNLPFPDSLQHIQDKNAGNLF